MSDNTDTGDTNATATATAITTTTTTTEVLHSDANNDSQNVPMPREALITTAVNFLQNAKVRHTTLMQKQQFLRSKGLTLEEIQLACERAGVFSNDPTINMGISSQTQTHSQFAIQPRQSAFGRIKEILHSIALLSGVAYAIYTFWKKFVEPFLFGRKKRPVNEALEDIEKKVDTRIGDVSRELTQLKESMSQQQREQVSQFNREFQIFRSDLEAIKGLLLNRKQFAAPLVGGTPSIPAWQLSSATPQLHHHHRLHQHSQSDDNEKADDAGSGSGSSETEVVTKNSDSSLEIM